MGINAAQLREYVIQPALEEIGLYSMAAEELVLGTAAHESKLGAYLHQVKGPALGIFQMEPATYRDIWERWLPGQKELAQRLREMTCGVAGPDGIITDAPAAATMIHDLRFAAAMCRVFYRRIKAPLPAAGDLVGQAAYWKRHYNTALGKGTPEQYAAAWRNLVA